MRDNPILRRTKTIEAKTIVLPESKVLFDTERVITLEIRFLGVLLYKSSFNANNALLERNKLSNKANNIGFKKVSSNNEKDSEETEEPISFF
jgi:hypothetical protein